MELMCKWFCPRAKLHPTRPVIALDPFAGGCCRGIVAAARTPPVTLPLHHIAHRYASTTITSLSPFVHPSLSLTTSLLRLSLPLSSAPQDGLLYIGIDTSEQQVDENYSQLKAAKQRSSLSHIAYDPVSNPCLYTL